MRVSVAGPLVVVALAAACSKPAYLKVNVAFDPQSLAGQVAQIELITFDKSADAGPTRLPATPQAGFFADGGTTLIVQAVPGSSVTAWINALDSTGNILASGNNSIADLAGGTSSLQLTLAPHCQTTRDCPPDLFCTGLVACVGPPSFASCISAADAGSAVGQPCGPCNGTCNDAGICWLVTCGCESTLSDGGQGYAVDPSVGQICNTPDNSDVDAGACRTNCQPAHCGDGVVDPGELCDLGADNGQGLGCNATCDLRGEVTTLVGNGGTGETNNQELDGFGTAAQVGKPYGLALGGGNLYVGELAFDTLREVQLTHLGGADNGPYVQTLAGGNYTSATCTADSDGPATDPNVGFCAPNAILPFDGGLLITDINAIRFFSFSSTFDGGTLSTALGSTASVFPALTTGKVGPGSGSYDGPRGMTFIGLDLYTNTGTDPYLNRTTLDTDPYVLSTVVTTAAPTPTFRGMAEMNGVIYTSLDNDLYFYQPGSSALSIAGDAGILQVPDGVCSDHRHSLYVCDSQVGLIWQYDVNTGTISLLAGGAVAPGTSSPTEQDGLGADAGFKEPSGCAFEPDAGVLYVSDLAGNTLRVIR